jgi:N-succinyldiaminopimelate aminotransferase
MNPLLDKLHPYPFEKLRLLFEQVTASPQHKAISLGMGEPKHPTPKFIEQALIDNVDGLAIYPTTIGSPEMRGAIAGWLERRYNLPKLNPATQVLPVNGSREALFALAQAVIDKDAKSIVVSPNPFYQIYEGAATWPAPSRTSSTPTRPAISAATTTAFRKCGSAWRCCSSARRATRPARCCR